MSVAIIPARGNSKRLQDKNIRTLGGKALIEWTIMAAKRSYCFSKIIVSSEDQRILNIAEHCGVYPLKRAKSLSQDHVGVIDVVKDILQGDMVELKDDQFVAVLLPTSPFRTSEMIKKAFSKIQQHNSILNACVVSVSAFSHTPFNSLVCEEGKLKPLIPNRFGLRTQEYESVFRPNGGIFLSRKQAFLNSNTLFINPMLPLFSDFQEGLDIDDEYDLLIGEALINRRMS